MINDEVDDADTPEKCLEKCNLDSNCNFWDIDSKSTCRHRSNEGENGEVETIGSSGGAKNCILGKCISKNRNSVESVKFIPMPNFVEIFLFKFF